MKKSDVVQKILGARYLHAPLNKVGKAFAPTNIALCKYWGKRDQELNLPVTSSLSISLGDKGATAEIKVSDRKQDVVILNGLPVNPTLSFSKRLVDFLNLFREHATPTFFINIESNIPIAAGLASSAAGFASIVAALDDLFGWELSREELSLLARLGSGSAARSLWQGFVEWHVGARADGMDSVGEALPETWPEFCVGLLIFSNNEKEISSREGMQRTVTTSRLYADWPAKVAADLKLLKQAIKKKDFNLLGKVAEANAIAMHATMLDASPPVNYSLPATCEVKRKIQDLRKQGLDLYFTQDAGPNLKLLFLQKDVMEVKKYFPDVEVIQAFQDDWF